MTFHQSISARIMPAIFSLLLLYLPAVIAGLLVLVVVAILVLRVAKGQ